ncbi:Protein MAINTENANCE OF MERISTEMS [Glycine max]|nr:Protein MAINTENANCE OF MERISTEMS [Glycine max]
MLLINNSSPTSEVENETAAATNKRKRRHAGTPDPDAEVVSLSPKTFAGIRLLCFFSVLSSLILLVSIMVRTGGSGWTLDRVIRKALVAPVVEHVDHATKEVHEQPQEAPGDDVVSVVEGFPGGPYDTLVLMDYAYHVTVTVWNKEEHPELKLSSHVRKVEKFGRHAPEIEGLVIITGLSPLIACAFHSFETLHVDDVIFLLVELLKVSFEEDKSWDGCTLFANKSATHVHVVFLDAFRDLTQSGSYASGAAALVHMYDILNDASKSSARQLAGYITLLQHFPSIVFAITARDYDERKPHACRWKSGKALSMLTYCKHLDVLVSYAICWIPYSDHRAFREFELISLFFRHMCWGPSIIIHRPERVMRQFEYVQTIPPHPATPCLSVEEIDDRWIQFFEYLALVGQACVAPRQCATDYME